jgi:hypothetical protein
LSRAEARYARGLVALVKVQRLKLKSPAVSRNGSKAALPSP